MWEDIERKFTEFLEGRKDAPVHFLGAMVLDQKQTPTTHVDKRQVIDGQQRLTTLQIFLTAFRDFCRAQGAEEMAREVECFTLNKGMMAEPEVDKFKVWPTQLDRAQFRDVVTSGSRAELEKKHPLVRQKYARSYDPRPKMVEAYFFFHDSLSTFFLGTEAEQALCADVALASRLEEAFQALKNALQVVVIDLEAGDDAQVMGWKPCGPPRRQVRGNYRLLVGGQLGPGLSGITGVSRIAGRFRLAGGHGAIAAGLG